jgi:hypothetical protein
MESSMFGVEAVPIVHLVQEPKIAFDLKKTRQVYDNYVVNWHAGLTMVMGHPFGDAGFRKHIAEEQEALKDVFISYGLEDFLILYDVNSQVHATLIELAGQHDKEKKYLSEEELLISSKTKNLMNINYSVHWIKKTQPFDVELGPDVLSEGNRDQTLLITDAGQLAMKGRAKDRKLLAEIRAEFEKEAGVVHKYGNNDDEFYFVIGYLKSDIRLNDRQFRLDLEQCIEVRRQNIQLTFKVDSVKIIMYQNYSLDQRACLWESKEFKLLQEPELSHKNLFDTVLDIIKVQKFMNQQQEQEVI